MFLWISTPSGPVGYHGQPHAMSPQGLLRKNMWQSLNQHPSPYFKPQALIGALSWSYGVRGMPAILRFSIPVRSLHVCTTLSLRDEKGVIQSCTSIWLCYGFLVGGNSLNNFCHMWLFILDNQKSIWKSKKTVDFFGTEFVLKKLSSVIYTGLFNWLKS